MLKQTLTFKKKYVDHFICAIHVISACLFFVQKVQHSAIFFAVHCKQNDMLDLFMGNQGLDLTIRDIVS